jgi:hypothetical protein
MNHFLLETYGMQILDGADGEDPVRWQVRELLAGMYPPGAFERRREQRYPLPKLIQLRPISADGATPLGSSVIVSGKHISETGLSFFHPEPLPYRLVAATLEKLDGTHCQFVIDVGWCRFTQLGWYESGGKFIRQIDGPTPPSADSRAAKPAATPTEPAADPTGEGI